MPVDRHLSPSIAPKREILNGFKGLSRLGARLPSDEVAGDAKAYKMKAYSQWDIAGLGKFLCHAVGLLARIAVA